jgi:hypothetical protein
MNLRKVCSVESLITFITTGLNRAALTSLFNFLTEELLETIQCLGKQTFFILRMI